MLGILAVGIRLEAALGAEKEIMIIRFEMWFIVLHYIDLDYSIGPTR